ncbi:MAG TPA: tetratricopeptide repeat protein [Acidimicrobiia bacterium]|nr:tetratricopeptide repeat protein [Acidimicrobiia bacterium]
MTATDEEREHLEAERDFLLRSLDDLETERAAGDVDDESYARLHDDYTARAAAVIRALRDGVDARTFAPPLPMRRRLLVGGAIAAFALAAAVALAAALGARLPGELASGNPEQAGEQERDTDDRRAALEAAVDENPDDVVARLALARFLEADGDLAGALRQYDEVTARDPGHADALAQGGRILYLTASQTPPEQAAELVAAAQERLDRAIAADPEYADARFFRAVLLAQELLDRDLAISDAQRYLVLAPDGPFAEQARALLADLDAPIIEATTVPPIDS